MPLSFSFTHEGMPFRCFVQKEGAQPEPGQWMVEVGGNIHAVCEAGEQDDTAAIEEQAIRAWELSQRRSA